MTRTFLMLTVAALAASGCSMTPTVTKQRMALADANIENMECRRQTSVTSSIPKTICTSETVWKKWDDKQADASASFIDTARDRADNRLLYRNQ